MKIAYGRFSLASLPLVVLLLVSGTARSHPPSPVTAVEVADETRSALSDALQCRLSKHDMEALLIRLRHARGAQEAQEAQDDEVFYVKLPVRLDVLGQAADTFQVRPDEVRAVLAGPLNDALVSSWQLKPHHYPRSSGIWITPIAQRNDGNGWIRQRVLEVEADPRHPSNLLVGCRQIIDSRAQQRERAGDDASVWFAPDAQVFDLAEALLSCTADRRAAVMMTTALMLKGPPDAPFVGWVDESDKERFQWRLPKPMTLRGSTLETVRMLDGVLFGVVEDASARQFAQRWDMEAGENELGETLYVRDLPVRVAGDGWEEHRTRLVMDLDDGVTIAGCRYGDRTAEFGAWPEEDKTQP